MKQLTGANIWRDVNAGVVVFFVAVPLCLGIALASKAPLMSGIIAGIIGGIVVGALSGSQLGVSGPAAGLVATVIAGITALGSFEAFCLATLIAGGIQLALGFIGAGTLARYFPTSVIKGMLAAIGIIIIFKQIPHMVGYDADYEGDFNFRQADGHNTLTELGFMLDAMTPGAVLIGCICLVVLILWNLPAVRNTQPTTTVQSPLVAFLLGWPAKIWRVMRNVPGPLIAVLLGVGLQLLFEATGSSLALTKEHLVAIPTDGSPVDWISLPDFSFIRDERVWLYAGIIALVASVESLLCAEATDKIDPELRVANKNRELVAQGVGNTLAGLVGGLPITQVIVRSSANVQAGAKSRLSAIIHGCLILLAVLFIPGGMNKIPMASLAAVLIMVGYNLAKPSLFKKYFKKGWSQFIPFFITIPAVYFTDLLIGVGIGIAVAIFFLLRRNFRAPYTYEMDEEKGHKIITLKLASIVSFLNKGVIIQTLEAIPRGSNVTIDATDTGLIDPDVVEVIEDFAKSAPSRGIDFKLIGTLDHVEIVKNPAKELNKRLAHNDVMHKLHLR